MRRSNRVDGGIYYVIRLPAGWKLVTYKFSDVEDDANHYDWWQETVAPQMAKAWSQKLEQPMEQLLEEVELLSYAFPRGRLSRVDSHLIFVHGADLTAAMKITKKKIEQALNATKCEWQFDEHEQCQMEDKEAMRRILGISEDWSAV